ncbi:MAG: hypothetical protein NTV51_20135 [Verrucomicrobia bacterium]|nr:hypothetical protein [Verrucomicrobiota bacterium]
MSSAAALALLAAPPPPVPPSLAAAPRSLTVAAGARSVLDVAVTGTAPFGYQWLRNGTAIAGATSATLTFDPTFGADAAAYAVTVTNAAGSLTSGIATLTVTPLTRISNLSVLTSLASFPDDNFTLGYVVGGASPAAPKPVLLRAAGPALGSLGVGGTLDDPRLELFVGATKTSENDNWGGDATLTSAFGSVGAFPFPSVTSRDAAAMARLTVPDNSAKITSTNAGSGLVLAEIYDATPSDRFIPATPRLLNVSVLKSLGAGLTVGFTLAGSAPKTVLLRAIGPTLGGFGIAEAVADPRLALFNSTSLKLAENDNWGGTAELTAAFAGVGAFGLPASSKDAALLATLPPGGYSVQVTGLNGTTGTVLVEVYEVP